MKSIREVEPNKLRGEFYTSPHLVEWCFQRIASLIDTQAPVHLLEPSAGDGAFIRGLQPFVANQRIRSPHVTCIELIEEEAAQCDQELGRSGLLGQVMAESFFTWAGQNTTRFDAIVGNPPFIRYQFVPENDRFWAEWLLRACGRELDGVSNIWIPFVLLSLNFLREGGAFALVLPSELFATVSGAQVRSELLRHFDSLRIDLFPRNSFPDILQDVVVVSGVRASAAEQQRHVTFCEVVSGIVREWQHEVAVSDESWTRFLLTSAEWDAFAAAKSLRGFTRLGEIATIGVAIVTGANEFFTVDDTTVAAFDLAEWTRPLLARTADSPGLVFTEADHKAARCDGKRAWLLDFSADKPAPMDFEGATRYLQRGILEELPARYKCRIRSPWYRVPQVQNGALMMAKRAHYHHRLLLNPARVFTTDTIYRGEMKAAFRGQEARLVSGFHNSATLLSAELEGRTYGGGVLELVPSEISRLVAPMADTEGFLHQLDHISREVGGQRDTGDTLVEATDGLLCRLIPGYCDLLSDLISARNRLRLRRFHG